MTEDDLIADVLAAPDADEPRLVYADFLQERGDPQGELITVQCEVKRLEREGQKLTPEYRRAYQRERELARTFEEAFVKGAGRGFHVAFKRGFIDYVSAPNVDLLLENRALFERHPVRQLSCDVESLAELRRLAETPLASRLDEITLWRRDSLTLDAQLTFALTRASKEDAPVWLREAGLPHETLLPAVKRVHYWPPTETKFEDLIRATLPRLRDLSCAESLRHTGNTFERLVRTETFEALERLSMQALTDQQMILALRRAGALRELTFMLGPRPDPALIAPALASSRALPHLVSLSIACDEHTIDVLDARAKKLEVLIAMDRLSALGLDALAKGRLPRRLEHLSLNAAPGKPRCTSLLQAPFERLLYLGLGNFEVGRDLADAPALETLTGLRLYGCIVAHGAIPAIRARWPFVSIE